MPENIFEGVDYLTPNETEAAYFSGLDKVETTDDARKAAQILMGRGAKSVLITLGGQGAFYYDGKVEYTVAPPEAKVVDKPGAGDAFHGAFATALSEGKDSLTAITVSYAHLRPRRPDYGRFRHDRRRDGRAHGRLRRQDRHLGY